MSQLAIHLFGPFQLKIDNQILPINMPDRSKALFSYLIAERDRAHSRQTLAGFMWPDLPKTKALNNLRYSLHVLRQALAEAGVASDCIHSARQTVQFDPEKATWLDVETFSHYIALSETPGEDRIRAWQNAVQHYQGEFLQDFDAAISAPFEEWVLMRREFYARSARKAFTGLATYFERRQAFDETIDYAQQLLTIEPWQEKAHRQIMRGLALTGHRNAALAQYQTCQHILDEALAVPPSEETTALYHQIRDQALLPPETPIILDQPEVAAALNPSVTFDPIKILSRLDPLPDQRLFGIETAKQILERVIHSPDRPWLIAVDGIGGIGKTSLAHKLVQDLAQQMVSPSIFIDAAWISAKQTFFSTETGLISQEKPALDADTLTDHLLVQLLDETPLPATPQEKHLMLMRRLKESATLIVIDNLETVVDYQALMPFLRQLVNPSKVLLTTRHSLKAQTDVYCLSLNELQEIDALSLLRFEAGLSGNPLVRAVTDAQLARIYGVVGGNPLALKLVLGQINFLSLNDVLDSLVHAKGQQAEDLYTYIYWQAWQMLDDATRSLFVALPVCPNGIFSQLESLTQLSQPQLQQSLQQLISLSLVTVGGDLEAPRYRLHRLTETFLMNEVLKWQQIEEADATSNSETAYYSALFRSNIANVLRRWHNHEALKAVDMTVLETVQESILKTISLALSLSDQWHILRTVIIDFSPYMERRGYWREWNRILQQAIESARQSRDIDHEITLSALLARLYQQQRNPQKTIYHYRQAIRIAQQANNQYELARACSNLGFAYIDEGYWWRSEVLSCSALKIFEALDSKHGKAHTHNHLGLLYTRKHAWTKAAYHLKMACHIWEDISDNFGLMYGLENRGLLHLEMGQPKEAISHFELALDQAILTGEKAETGKIWNNLGRAHSSLKNFATAKNAFDEAETILRNSGNHLDLARILHNLGVLYEFQNETEASRQHLMAALDLFRSLENQDSEARVLADLVEFQLGRENFSEAAGYMHQLEALVRPNSEAELRYQELTRAFEEQGTSLTNG
ncbi:MAG: tetratricopeptide repeat protein [Chloroflexota bacterium]